MKVVNTTALPWYAPIASQLRQKPREFTAGVLALLIMLLIPVSLFAKDYPKTQKEFSVNKVTPEVKSAQTKKMGVTAPPTKAPEGKYYVVTQNESLWHIAEKVYGDGHMYVKLIQLNNIPNPNNIEVGTKLLFK